jgi:uncharacterized protein (DUF58 family)
MLKRWFYINFRCYYRMKNLALRRVRPMGAVLLGCLAVSAALGVDTNQTMAHNIFALVFFLFFFSALSILYPPPKLRITRNMPRYATVGEPLEYQVVAENPGRRMEKGLVLIEVPPDPRPGFEELVRAREPHEAERNAFDRFVGYYRWEWLVAKKTGARFSEIRLPDIPARGSASAGVTVVPARRGRLRLEGAAVCRPDPLGLLSACRVVDCPDEVTVLPKRYRVPETGLPGGKRRRQAGGVALASSVGDSVEFVSLRDYRPGDPLRRIHWRSWAKAGRPVVKECQEEYFIRHALVLDTACPPEKEAVFEEAVSVAAGFAMSSRSRESLLDLMFAGGSAYCFTSGRGLAQANRVLEVLASVSMSLEFSFSSLAAQVLRRAARMSGCVLVLLAWDEERRALVQALLGNRVPVLVLVVTDGRLDNMAPLPAGMLPGSFHLLAAGKIQEGLSRL